MEKRWFSCQAQRGFCGQIDGCVVCKRLCQSKFSDQEWLSLGGE